MPPRASRWRHVAIPILVLSAFIVLLLGPYAITAFLLTGDLRDVYLPIEAFYRRELASGRLPVWDPVSALGFPVLASSQIGFWYPPLMLLRVFPPEAAFAIAYLLHGMLLASGVTVYLRTRGRSMGASLFGALALTGSGFVIGHLPHANVVFSLAWFPWTLVAVERLATKLRPSSLLGWALTVVLSALTGQWQVALMVAGFSAMRLLVALRSRRPVEPWQHTVWSWGLCTGACLVLVTLLTAAQLLPTAELMRESSRGYKGGFDIKRANQHSFPPWQAISFLVPGFFGMPDLSEYWGKRPLVEMGAWVGALPLLLAMATLVRPRSADTRFWLWTGAIGFLLALGHWSPVRVLGIEPTIGIFSGPARYLLLTHVALAVLAAKGLDHVRERTARAANLAGTLGIAAAVSLTGAAFLLRAAPAPIHRLASQVALAVTAGRAEHALAPLEREAKVDYLLERLGTKAVNLGNPLILLSVFALGAGGILLRRSAKRGASPLFLPMVAALTVVELTALSWHLHPSFPWGDVFKESPVIAIIRDRPWGRLYVVHPQGDTGLLFANQTTDNRREHERLIRDLAVPNIHTRAGIPGIAWPAALDLADAARVLDRMRDPQGRPRDENILDRLGVRYVAGSTLTPGLVLPPPAQELASFPSGDGATIRVWERPTARPRAELLTDAPRSIDDPLPSNAGAASIASDTSQRVAITVDNTSGREAVLILRDTFFPGWNATLDGRSVPVERADSLFRGIRVPPGEHAVVFRYRSRSAITGMAVSAVTMVALALIAVRAARRSPSVKVQP